ncbi:MAG: hypothetical protein LBN33_00275 [Desulfovibrio sp.]|jgi:predicted esterase YcpF (UPF0227 family)|nr:hypothetical protein [Desulfovibrio sp.]
MIINIHGFTGSGNNSKYRWLQDNIQDHEIYSPTFDYSSQSPQGILDRLSEKVACCSQTKSDDLTGLYVLGSSLGAFFARCLNLLYPKLTTVLINPALAPFLPLRGYIDCRAYLALLANLAYADDNLGDESRLYVIMGDADEVINHEKMTRPLLPPNFKRIYVIRGGVHRLDLGHEVSGILKSIFGNKT